MLDGWENFFLGQVGASAALAGLLFVAISLNLSRITTAARLTDRALLAVCLLLAILVASSLMLVPDQPASLLGVEMLAIGAVLGGLFVRTKQWRRPPDATPPPAIVTVAHTGLFAVAALPYLVAALLLFAGSERAAIYWLAAAMIASFAKAVLDAWVLMVEINR